MSLDTVTFLDGLGATVEIGVVTIGGVKAPAHIMVDGNGAAYTAANPLLTAPGILTVDFTNRSGTITTSGATALDIAANAGRKGGWIRAAITNVGNILVTLRKPDGVTVFQSTLAAGETFSFIVNPGYVLPHETLISGDHAQDLFEGVEFS